jgi:hypothetical protein
MGDDCCKIQKRKGGKILRHQPNRQKESEIAFKEYAA